MREHIREARALIMICMLTLFTALFMGACDQGQSDSKTSLGFNGDMKTVTHDGHKFIVVDYNGRVGGPLHHPDCPCTTKK